MNRPSGISIIWSIIPAVTFSCNTGKKSDSGPGHPNVILILADDLGYGDLSCYGQTNFTTPNIDSLAAGGIKFTRFYCGSTVSAPSRASLLSGKHTGHTSIRGNNGIQVMGDEEITLAKIMKQAGYKTGCIGKWGIGNPPPTDDPEKKGFDYFYGYINMWHAHNYFPEFLYRNGEKVYLRNKLQLINGKNPWEESPEGAGVAAVKIDYAHDLFEKEALTFIEKYSDKRFFLMLTFNVPHTNNENKPNGMEVPDYHDFSGKNWPEPEKGFAAMIRNLDNSVGKITLKLRELGIDKKTMVIFCSDNGPHQESGHKSEFFNSSGGLRGLKRDLYEGGIRTPFIASWPDNISPGGISDHVAAFWDILPTFCDLTGTKIPIDSDGISFCPTLFGKEQVKNHKYLYWEFYEQGGKQAILMDSLKAIRLNVSSGWNNIKFELYNLNNDPCETKDIAEQYPKIKIKFDSLFSTARIRFPVQNLFMEE